MTDKFSISDVIEQFKYEAQLAGMFLASNLAMYATVMFASLATGAEQLYLAHLLSITTFYLANCLVYWLSSESRGRKFGPALGNFWLMPAFYISGNLKLDPIQINDWMVAPYEDQQDAIKELNIKGTAVILVSYIILVGFPLIF